VGGFAGLALGRGRELPDAEDAKVTQRTQKREKKENQNKEKLNTKFCYKFSKQALVF
jgi:hypothetical protein